MPNFGRSLQVFGLAILPLAMILQLMDSITLGKMLIMCVMGGSAFWIGRIVEGYARR